MVLRRIIIKSHFTSLNSSFPATWTILGVVASSTSITKLPGPPLVSSLAEPSVATEATLGIWGVLLDLARTLRIAASLTSSNNRVAMALASNWLLLHPAGETASTLLPAILLSPRLLLVTGATAVEVFATTKGELTGAGALTIGDMGTGASGELPAEPRGDSSAMNSSSSLLTG
eukprot:CAMPEP_0181070354 /NCGR_PEP_ID=MMETSP1070-20121207/27438_1 /TAXON_ID=265543 /ORGANISM="Minutocellus polymorphus, Strain NH13" /LENGTH=173 /DNA_ID=CAMNT_0023151227 /DNA_START=115 /DNA_END=633 /DNA_ORIENTATION=+